MHYYKDTYVSKTQVFVSNISQIEKYVRTYVRTFRSTYERDYFLQLANLSAAKWPNVCIQNFRRYQMATKVSTNFRHDMVLNIIIKFAAKKKLILYRTYFSFYLI